VKQRFWLDHLTFAARATGDPSSVAAAMRAAAHAVDPEQAIESATMQGTVAASISEPRFHARMFLVFSLLALFLAAIGIYGVLAYAVSERRHEIGVRVALGAASTDVTRLVLRRTFGLVVPGLVVGAAVSLGITRLLTKLLFGVSPTDPVTFAVVALVLLLVAVIASVGPARSASRVDPIIVLRQEG